MNNALSEYFGRNLAVFSPTVFDTIFDDFEKAFSGSQGGLPYDLYAVEKEKDQIDRYEIVYAVAGYTKQDISVEVMGDELWVDIKKGLHGDESEFSKKYLHQGICRRTHKGKFKMMSIIDKDNIKTSLKDGLLTISLPLCEKAGRRHIEIN